MHSAEEGGEHTYCTFIEVDLFVRVSKDPAFWMWVEALRHPYRLACPSHHLASSRSRDYLSRGRHAPVPASLAHLQHLLAILLRWPSKCYLTCGAFQCKQFLMLREVSMLQTLLICMDMHTSMIHVGSGASSFSCSGKSQCCRLC